MTIRDAQGDLRRAFVGGGPGVFISAMVWFAAAVVERTHGIGAAFAVLFFGGMLIFPLATLASRLVFGREKEASGNPLGATAIPGGPIIAVGAIELAFATLLTLRASRTKRLVV